MKKKYEIDILEKFNIFSLNNINVKRIGEINIKTNEKTKEKIININGTISSKNQIEIPNKNYLHSLNIIGENYIIEISANPNFVFGFSLDFSLLNQIKKYTLTINYKYPLNKISFNNYDENKYEIEIPLRINFENKTHSEKINPEKIIENNIENFKEIDKSSLEICLDSIIFFGHINIYHIYIDKVIKYITQKNRIIKKIIKKKKEKEKNIELEKYFKEIEEKLNKEIKIEKKEEKKKDNEESIEEEEKETIKQDTFQTRRSIQQSINDSSLSIISLTDRRSFIGAKMSTIINGSLTESLIYLKHIVNYDYSNCQNFYLFTNKFTVPYENFIVFSSFHVIVKMSLKTHIQNFYESNDKINPVSNFVVLNGGNYFLSVQEKKLNVYQNKGQNFYPIKIYDINYINIKVFEVNDSNSYLLIVGDSDKKKDLITIFDITNLKKINEYIKQVSPYKINKMKFNPSDTNILISSGKNNLRVYNLKNHCLIGKNINLFQNRDKSKNIKRNSEIIEFHFLKSFIDDIFAITKNELLIIDYLKKEIEKKYIIDESELTNFYIDENYIIISNEKEKIYFWENSGDEEEYSLKNTIGEFRTNNYIYNDFSLKNNIIKHIPLCIKSLEENEDNLYYYGDNYGDILAINPKEMKGYHILKSSENIKEIFFDFFGDYLITITENGMFHILHNGQSYQEIFYYYCQNDKATYASFPPLKNNEFIFGFESGFIRIFNLSEKKLINEVKVFKDYIKIIFMGFIQENHLILILNEKGEISINNINENYIVIKQLFINEKIPKEISISKDQKKIAIYNGDKNNIDNNLITVYDCFSFDPIQRIFTENFGIINIYLAHSNILCVIFENSSLHFYSLINKEGLLLKKIENIFSNIDSMYITNNYKYFFINSKKNGEIYILDSDCLFEEENDNQKIKVTNKEFSSINFNENKSEIIISYDKIINVWKFGGDLTFSESKMLEELIKLNNKNYVNQILHKSERSLLIENTTRSFPFEKKFEIYDKKRKKKSISENLENEKIINIENEEYDNNPNEEILKIQEEMKRDKDEISYLKKETFEKEIINIFKEKLNKEDIKDEKEEDSKEKRLKQKILMQPDLHYKPENIENLKE